MLLEVIHVGYELARQSFQGTTFDIRQSLVGLIYELL